MICTCVQDKRLSNDELLSFLRSIASQSSTLSSIFCKDAETSVVASAAEMEELRALAGIGFGPSIPQAPTCPEPTPARQTSSSTATKVAAASKPPLAHTHKRGLEPTFQAPLSPKRTRSNPHAVMAAVTFSAKEEPQEHYFVEPAHSAVASGKQAPLKRTRRPKITEPTDEENRLMREWSMRRVSEIVRRQNETSGVDSSCPDARRKAAFMRFVMTELRRALPVQQLPLLLEQIRRYSAGLCTPNDFSNFVWDLVERNNTVVPLTHQPEVNIRPRPHSWLTANKNGGSSSSSSKAYVNMDVDDDDDEEESFSKQAPAAAKHAKASSKVNSNVKSESSSDDDAQCPVCASNAIEDER
jgi:hypothetical protein